MPSSQYGNDSFKTCLATLGYTGDKPNPTLEFIINSPYYHAIKVYSASPHEIYTCVAHYKLKAYVTKYVEFMLHNAAPVLRKNEILITTLEWDNIHILPSKSNGFSMRQKIVS